jgi:putative transcriptional regulator
MHSYLKALVAEKEIREKRKLPIRRIAAESRASRSAIQRLLNDTIKLVPLDDLERLCRWLPCHAGELLRLDDPVEQNTPTTTTTQS